VTDQTFSAPSRSRPELIGRRLPNRLEIDREEAGRIDRGRSGIGQQGVAERFDPVGEAADPAQGGVEFRRRPLA